LAANVRPDPMNQHARLQQPIPFVDLAA